MDQIIHLSNAGCCKCSPRSTRDALRGEKEPKRKSPEEQLNNPNRKLEPRGARSNSHLVLLGKARKHVVLQDSTRHPR